MKPAAHRRVAHKKMPTASRNSRGIVETIPIEFIDNNTEVEIIDEEREIR